MRHDHVCAARTVRAYLVHSVCLDAAVVVRALNNGTVHVIVNN